MTSVQVLLRLARFRKVVRKLPALETPLWLGTVKPYQELEESIQRLIKVMEDAYENTEDRESAIYFRSGARVRLVDSNRNSDVQHGMFGR